MENNMSDTMKIAQMVEVVVSIQVDSFESLKSKVNQLGGAIKKANFIGLDTKPAKVKQKYNGRVKVTKYHVQKVKVAAHRNSGLIAKEIKEITEVPNSITTIRDIMNGEFDHLLGIEEKST